MVTITKTKKNEKLGYSDTELSEFESIINDKLEKAKNQLNFIKDSLVRRHSGAIIAQDKLKGLEDGTNTLEKENLTQMAARQQKFIKNLEDALIRIKNKTYGICVDTGKLIQKDRLKAVPHTRHSIEAKLNGKG